MPLVVPFAAAFRLVTWEGGLRDVTSLKTAAKETMPLGNGKIFLPTETATQSQSPTLRRGVSIIKSESEYSVSEGNCIREKA